MSDAGIPCYILPTTSSNNTKPSNGNTLLDLHDNSIQTIETNPKKKTKLTTQSYIDKLYTYKPTYANYFDFIGSNCLILCMVIYILVTVSGICVGGYFTILEGNDIQITRSSEHIWWKFVVIVCIFYLVILCNVALACFEYFEILDMDTDMQGPMISTGFGICIIISIMIIGAFILETSDWIYFGASLIFFVALCVCIGSICVILWQDTVIDSYQYSCDEFVSELKILSYGKDEFYMSALNEDQKFDYVLSYLVRTYCKNGYICLGVENLIYTFVSGRIIDIGRFVLSLTPGMKIDARDRWGKWYTAQILHYKPAHGSMSRELQAKLSAKQVTNIVKLQKLPGIFIHYDIWENKWDEWIFIDENSICTCISRCTKHKTQHRITILDTQSIHCTHKNTTKYERLKKRMEVESQNDDLTVFGFL